MSPFEWFIVGCVCIYASMNKYTIEASDELTKTLYTIGLILIIASVLYSVYIGVFNILERVF